MDLISLGITNGSILGELAESIDKIKATAEISTKQSEELANT